MQAGQAERDGKWRLVARTYDVELRETPIKANVLSAQIGIVVQAVGQDCASDVADDGVDTGVVRTNDRKAIEWQVMQKLHETCSQTLDVTVIRRHVVGVDVGHDREHRLQMHKRCV